MKEFSRRVSVAIALFISFNAFGASRPKTLAVVDFQNASGDKSLDSIGLGIMEEISTDLAGVRGVNLIERRELNEVLKELKFDRSQYVDPSAAQKIGKVLGADYMVVGGYQKLQDDIRLTARLVEVETGKVLLPAKAEGKYPADFFHVQDQLAESLRKGLVGGFAEEENSPVEPTTTNLEAFQNFSDGVKYYRDELYTDAAAKFESAVKLDPRYTLAHFYRGLAQEKQFHWEESLQSFKNALLGTEATNRQMWSWEVPYEKPGSERRVGAITFLQTKEERDLKKKEAGTDEVKLYANAQRFCFAEKVGKTSLLYFVDPFSHTFKRVALPDSELPGPFGFADSASKMAILDSFQPNLNSTSATWVKSAVDIDQGALRWKTTFNVRGGSLGTIVTDESFYSFLPGNGEILALDRATGQLRWKKSTKAEFLGANNAFLDIPSFGEAVVLCASNPAALHIYRGSDGSELWSLKGDCEEWGLSSNYDDSAILVLDPTREKVTGYRAVSGQKLFEIPVPLQKVPGDSGSGSHLVYDQREQTLYVYGKDKALYALDVGETSPINNRLVWKMPIDVPRSLSATREHLLVFTRNGYFVVFDQSGKAQSKVKVGDVQDFPIYYRDNLAILRQRDSYRVFGLDLKKGEQTWECKTWQEWSPAIYMRGMLLYQSGKKEITALDSSTGETLWHHLGEKSPVVIPGKNSVFVADITGVKEYVSPKADPATSVAEAEVVTHIAQCLLQLNRPDEALAQAQRVVRELDPDYPDAHMALARIYAQRGDRDSRRHELLAYYSLVDPKIPLAEYISQELKRSYGLLWRSDAEQAASIASDGIGKPLVLWGDKGWHSALDPESGGFLWNERADRTERSNWQAEQPVFLITRPSEESTTLQLWRVEPATGEKRMVSSVDLEQIPAEISETASTQQVLLWADESKGWSDPHRWRLLCIEVSTGKLLWQTKVDAKPEEYFFGAIAGEKRVAYASGQTLNIVAPESGKVIGQAAFDSQITGLVESPATATELYAIYGGRHLAVLDASTAKVSRTIDLPEGEYTRSLSRDSLQGSAFYFFGPHEVVAMDLGANPHQQDRILWRYSLPEAQRVEKIKLIGDQLYCLRDDQILLRLDSKSGKLLSENAVLWDLQDFTVNGDVLYGLSSDSQAYAMKLTSPSPSTGQ